MSAEFDPTSPSTPSTPSRRSVLVAGATAAGTVGVAVLAGCSVGRAGSASGVSTDGASTGSDPTGGGAAVALAKVADVPVGNAISATLHGQPILISQPAAGTIVAFTAICTHMGCTVMPAGTEFQCPCHGSVYNAATGAVMQGPAPAPLAKIPTHVVAGEVMSGA